MSQFGNTISINGITNLAEALRAAGYRGGNNLSLLQISIPDGGTTGLRVFITNDGLHPPGTGQVITATIVGTVTVAGNMVWTITAANLPVDGDEVERNVAVAVGDDDEAVAVKSAHLLSQDQNLASVFSSIVANGADVVFTAYPAENDGTMNAAYAEGTSDGLTADSTSTDTTDGSTTPTTAGIQIAPGSSNNLLAQSPVSGQFLDAGMIWLYPDTLDDESESLESEEVDIEIIVVGG